MPCTSKSLEIVPTQPATTSPSLTNRLLPLPPAGGWPAFSRGMACALAVWYANAYAGALFDLFIKPYDTLLLYTMQWAAGWWAAWFFVHDTRLLAAAVKTRGRSEHGPPTQEMSFAAVWSAILMDWASKNVPRIVLVLMRPSQGAPGERMNMPDAWKGPLMIGVTMFLPALVPLPTQELVFAVRAKALLQPRDQPTIVLLDRFSGCPVRPITSWVLQYLLLAVAWQPWLVGLFLYALFFYVFKLSYSRLAKTDIHQKL